MATRSVRITSKGQATIPKEIRDMLKTDVVEFEVVGGNVVVRPVSSVGGSLRRYSKGYVPIEEARGAVWEEVARERGGKKAS